MSKLKKDDIINYLNYFNVQINFQKIIFKINAN